MASNKLILEINDLNKEHLKLKHQFMELVVPLNKNITKRDIINYLSSNDIGFKDEDSKIFLESNNTNEILINDFGFQFSLRKLGIYNSFNICLDQVNTIDNIFKIQNEWQSIADDSYFMKEKVFSASNEVIEKVVEEYKTLIENFKYSINELSINRNIDSYSYYYEIYDGAVKVHNDKFFTIDEIIEHLKGEYSNFDI